MNFGRSVIIAHLWRPEVARRENLLRNFLRFVWKTTPYSIIFKVLFWKFLSPHQSTLLSSNFVKFADKKSAKSCVIYQTKKNKISAASPTVATARIVPKIGQGQPPTMYAQCSIYFILIGFLSAELYSRTREHCQIAS